jgi:hypothetical protein
VPLPDGERRSFASIVASGLAQISLLAHDPRCTRSPSCFLGDWRVGV